MRGAIVGVAVLLVGGLVALGWDAQPTSADNGPHGGFGVTTDACAGCHRAHTGQAEQLLVDAQPALCYTCHGASATGATTAVQSGSLYDDINRTNNIGALRGGGFDTARIKTTDSSLPPSGVDNTTLSDTGTVIGVLTTPATTNSWHTNDGTAGTMWGNGAISATSDPGQTGYALRCGSCHDPHGTGTYRILRTQPVGSGATTPVVVADEGTTKHYGITDYLRPFSGLDAAPAGRNISNWCAQCHTRYLATSSLDSGDAIFAYRHKIDTNSSNPGTPVCTNCHVAHGTNASMSGYASTVTWPDGTPGSSTAAGLTDNNNSRLLKMDNRGICQKCHNK